MYHILYSTFGIPPNLYHPLARLLGPIPPDCVDFVMPWRLFQKDMALTVTHLLGFCSFLSVWLSTCGTHNFSCNGPDCPSLDTNKV